MRYWRRSTKSQLQGVRLSKLQVITNKEIVAMIKAPTRDNKRLYFLITATKHPLSSQIKELVKRELVEAGFLSNNVDIGGANNE